MAINIVTDPNLQYVSKGVILETLKNLISSRLDRKKMELSRNDPDTLRIDKINAECDLLSDLKCHFEMLPGTVLSCSGFTSDPEPAKYDFTLGPEPATCDDIKNNVGKYVVITDIAEEYGYRRYFEWATGVIKNENGKLTIEWIEIHEPHIKDNIPPFEAEFDGCINPFNFYIWDESSMSLDDLIEKVYKPK